MARLRITLDGVRSGFSREEEFDASGSYRTMARGVTIRPEPFAADSYDRFGEEQKSLFEEQSAVIYSMIRRFGMKQATHAERFAGSIGLDLDDLKHIPGADSRDELLGRLVQKATWFALGGKSLDLLLGGNMNPNVHRSVWEFFSDYVHARGPYPAIKIGGLPYGVLPVTNLRSIGKDESFDDHVVSPDIQDRVNLILSLLLDDWVKMATEKRPGQEAKTDKEKQYVPRLGDDPADSYLEMVNIFGMQPHSTSYQVRHLEYDRLPGWHGDLLDAPEPFHRYNPLLLDELLSEKQEFTSDQQHTRNSLKHLDQRFQNIFNDPRADKRYLRYSPLLNLKSIGETALDELGIPPVFDGETDTAPVDWYKKDYLSYVRSLVSDHKPPYGFYGGNTSILSALLYESCERAAGLYNQEVYLNPNVREVEGSTYYEVKSVSGGINSTVRKGQDVVLLRSDTGVFINIKAPIWGRLLSLNVAPGDYIFVYRGDDSYLHGRTVTSKTRPRPDQPHRGTFTPFHGSYFRVRDDKGYTRMREEMAALGAQIILEIERLKEEGEDYIEAQRRALAEAVDLSSYRLDAWLTGISAQRIDKLRGKKNNAGQRAHVGSQTGFYFGAYGWIENLQRSKNILTENKLQVPSILKEFENDLTGGYIHCPSPEQAVVSAMFRQAFSAYQKNASKVSPYTLNLTSDRIQKSKWFLEGIRQGQQIDALLGYRFEKLLRDQKAHHLIHGLRECYPLARNEYDEEDGTTGGFAELTVVNGLQIIDKIDDVTAGICPAVKKPDEIQKVKKAVDAIANVLDGSADILLYEAALQMTRGNFNQAAAAMDAAKGEHHPPIPESLDTLLPGTDLLHKLVLLIESPNQSPSAPGVNPKAYVEPGLETWLQNIFGPMQAIGCSVVFRQKGTDERPPEVGGPGEVHDITLADLNLGYLDFLRLCEAPLGEGATKLEFLLHHAANVKRTASQRSKNPEVYATFEDGAWTTPQKQSIHDAVVLGQIIRAFLRRSRPLRDEDLAHSEENNSSDIRERISKGYVQEEAELLKKRVQACIEHLKRDRVPVSELEKYNLQSAYSNFAALSSDVSVVQAGTDAYQLKIRNDALRLAADVEMILDGYEEANEAVEKHTIVRDAIKRLFGEPFLALPRFEMTPAFRAGINRDQKLVVGDTRIVLPDTSTGGQERIRHWFAGCAAVEDNVRSFADFLLFAESWKAGNGNASTNPLLDSYMMKVVQYSDDATFPWVALDESEIRAVDAANRMTRPGNKVVYPEDAESIVVVGSEASIRGDRCIGLMIDEFSEVIPDRKIDTALAYQYNAPNNEAPQAILLATPYIGTNWTVDNLKDVVYDSLDLAKVRMVDIDAMKAFDYLLPLSYFVHLPYLK